MTPPFAQQPPANRRTILLLRLAGGVGLLLVLLSGFALITAGFSGSALTTGQKYVWSSGSDLFLVNHSSDRAADCTLQGSAENRWITIPRRSSGVYGDLQTNGARAHRFQSGPINVTCDSSDVSVSSGPLTRLYPIAATPWPLLAGIVLICVWRVRRGGRFSRLFFRSRC